MFKLKVLVLNNYHYRRGGADSIYFNTIDLLKSKGHEVRSFSLSHPENYPDQDDKYFAAYHDLPSKSLILKIFNLYKYFYSVKTIKNLKQLLEDFTPDIVHAHLLYGGLTSSVLSLLKKRQIPVVYSAHDYKLICPNQSFLINGATICEACKGKHYFKSFLKKCNRNNRFFSLMIGAESYFRDIFFPINTHIKTIIASCDFGKSKHVEFRPDLKNKIVRLYNYAPNLEKIESEIIQGNYFLFFGRLSPEKGLKTLLESWKGVPKSCILKIAGTGPLESEIQNIIKESSLSNVELIGYVSGNNLFDLIKKSSFIMVPSEWYENNPMTVIEGFSYAKPAIGSRIGGIPELIMDNYTGFLFDSRNTKQLADCIIRASNLTYNEYTILSKNARSFVEEQCSSDVHYGSLIDIYKSAI